MPKTEKPEPSPIKLDRNGFVRCRVCGCTEEDACSPPCGWAEDDLCTTCATAAEALAKWMEEARRPNRAALEREVERRVGQ